MLSIPSTEITLKSAPAFTKFVQDWNVQVTPAASWYKVTGDISNCYDELDHKAILKAVQWGLSMLKHWLGRRHAKYFTVNKLNRKKIVVQRNVYGKDWIEIKDTDVLKICEYDVTHSDVLIDGVISRRLLGAPMGGFLSAFYAILLCAMTESTIVTPALRKLGLPRGAKRYLDDVIIALAYTTAAQLVQIQEFVQLLAKAYPPPLVLNLELQGDQEFLESLVSSQHHILFTTMQNKALADHGQGLPYIRCRLAGKDLMPIATVKKRVQEILMRTSQTCSHPECITMTCWMLQMEALIAGMHKSIVTGCIQKQMRVPRTKEEENALAKACL